MISKNPNQSSASTLANLNRLYLNLADAAQFLHLSAYNLLNFAARGELILMVPVPEDIIAVTVPDVRPNRIFQNGYPQFLVLSDSACAQIEVQPEIDESTFPMSYKFSEDNNTVKLIEHSPWHTEIPGTKFSWKTICKPYHFDDCISSVDKTITRDDIRHIRITHSNLLLPTTSIIQFDAQRNTGINSSLMSASTMHPNSRRFTLSMDAFPQLAEVYKAAEMFWGKVTVDTPESEYPDDKHVISHLINSKIIKSKNRVDAARKLIKPKFAD